MLETIILKSAGSTTCRIRSSIFRDILVGDFDARAGGDLQVDGELAGVGLREERHAQQRINRQAGYEQAQQTHDREHRASRSARRTERS